MKRIAPLCLAWLTLVGCLPPHISPVLPRRYASRTFVVDTARSVRVSAFSVPVPRPSAAGASLATLDGAGQAALVDAMAGRTTTAASLARALGMPLRAEEQAQLFQDRSLVRRELVFSVRKLPSEPDRISTARVRAMLRPGNRFVGWNRIENQYETRELGSLSLSRTRGTSGTLGLTLPFLSAAPNLSASAETKLDENVTLQERRPVLVGELGANEVSLLQEGAERLDLTGNVTADVEIALRPAGDQTVVFTSGSPTGAGACRQGPGLQTRVVRYPRATDDAKVDVVLEYVLRHVRKGDATSIEGDDSVEFAAAADTVRGVQMVAPEELRFSVYQLRLGSGVLETAAPVGSAVRGALEFERYEDANAFLAWMRRCGVRPPGLVLSTGSTPLKARDLARLYIWLQPVNWQP